MCILLTRFNAYIGRPRSLLRHDRDSQVPICLTVCMQPCSCIDIGHGHRTCRSNHSVKASMHMVHVGTPLKSNYIRRYKQNIVHKTLKTQLKFASSSVLHVIEFKGSVCFSVLNSCVFIVSLLGHFTRAQQEMRTDWSHQANLRNPRKCIERQALTFKPGNITTMYIKMDALGGSFGVCVVVLP